jgi:MoxR-like ATPase
VVLIDEVNRSTAKTQSALLEAMEEHRISVDGVTYDLPEPFFVIATQNPQHAVGTFPLPESQLDRFLMRIELGVPDRASERAMLLGMDRREMLKELKPVFSPGTLLQTQGKMREGARFGGAAGLPAGFAGCFAATPQHRIVTARRSGFAALIPSVGANAWTRHGLARRYSSSRNRSDGASTGVRYRAARTERTHTG